MLGEEVAVVQTLQSRPYTIAILEEEAMSLVKQGLVGRHQPIYTLCRYIPAREWVEVELELERHEFLLRDRIIDLLSRETWKED
jgi:Domain of unknown function (DUF4327)